MRRREFITGLAGAAALRAWPLTARAQQRPLPVIGLLQPQSVDVSNFYIVAFLQSLKEAGFVEGRNVAIEYRGAENQPDRLPALAADLVRRRVAVIVAGGIGAALAAKEATTTIPVVFYTGTDPVASGLVASLSRPGGNLTGNVILTVELAPKRLQLLHELVPDSVLFGVLADPRFPNGTALQTAARIEGVQLVVVNATTDSELETAFATFSQKRVGGILVLDNGFLQRRMEQLAALAARHALPAIYPIGEYARAGGLMSYGSTDNIAHVIGSYVGRILKGEKPADLPVQQATRFGLTLNLKTANALGLTIPPRLLALADEVIE
jgi:putative ABC transport system substrate-binding protein